MDKELYGILTEIRDIAISTKTELVTMKKIDADHEERIRMIESKPARTMEKGKIAAIVALITAIITVTINAVWEFIFKK